VAVIRIQDGPASPISPDYDSYYYKLERHACTELSNSPTGDPEGALFAALGSVCLAIAHPGRTVDWAAARRAYQQAKKDLSGCLLNSGRDTLGRALDAHKQHPTAPPTFGTPPTGSACPPVIRSVALLTDPATGSKPVLTIVGDYLFEVTKVRVGPTSRKARSPAEPNWVNAVGCGVLTVPNPPTLTPGRTVKIRVYGAGYVTSYTWKVQPAVSSDQIADHSGGPCAITLTTASPSP
jgi:hypothetical protein